MSKRNGWRLLPVPAVLAAAAIVLVGAGSPAGAAPAKSTGATAAGVLEATATVHATFLGTSGFEGEAVEVTGQAPATRMLVDAGTYAALKAEAKSAGGAGALPAGIDVAPKQKKKEFEGSDATDVPPRLRPPDTHAAVGLTQVVEVSNSLIAVYQKNNGALVTRVSLNTFFGYPDELIFDPRVVYDHWAGRFIVSAEAFPEVDGDQRHFVAFSTSGNGAGSYNKYNICCFDFGDTGFWDYPDLGYDDEATNIVGNFFFNAGGVDSRVFGLDKSIGYAGGAFPPIPVITGLEPTTRSTIVPYDAGAHPHLIGSIFPSGSAINIYRCENLETATPACFTEPDIVVPFYSIPPNADQSGTSDDLDTIDGRFQNASYQVGNFVHNLHTINMGGDPGLRWYELNHTNSTVGQNGNTQVSATSDDWNPSNAVNSLGEVFVTYSSTDAPAGINARVRITGRSPADASMGAGSNIHTSPTFYNPSGDTVERWGDYSAVSLDPKVYRQGACAAHRRAWIANEYAKNTLDWANRHARIGFC